MSCHVSPSGEGHSHHHSSTSNTLKWRMIVCALLTLPFLVQMAMAPFFHEKWLSVWIAWLLATLVEGIGGWLFFIGSLAALKNKSPDMNVLVTLGTMSAYLLSVVNVFLSRHHQLYFESSAFIITFVLIGLVIEEKTQSHAKASFKALLSLQPQETIRLKKEGGEEVIRVEEVALEDRLLIKAGQTLPVDGELEKGEGAFDESSLTGEAEPKYKKGGDKVFAGTINLTHTIEMRAKVVGKETVIGKTIALVKKASEQKPKVQRLADQISAYFVPLVLGIALITCIMWLFFSGSYEKALIAAVSVLVIACPCALGMATPIVTLVASLKMAKEGVLIREIEPFFTAYKIKHILFDKTGTLTENKLRVSHIESAQEQDRWAPILMSLCSHSDHPISSAIMAYLEGKAQKGSEVARVKTLPGLGIGGVYEGKPLLFGSPAFFKGLGKTLPNQKAQQAKGSSSLLWLGDELLCQVFIKSRVKASAYEVVSFLKKQGIESHLVSGDSQEASDEVAEQVGIEHVKGGALPEDKMHYLQSLQKQGRVAMCGDGINDAAALVGADVSFAMGDGVDVAMQSASMGLTHGQITGVETVVRFSKKANHTIYTNFFFAFIFNVVGIGMATLGWLHPGVAAAAMALSSFLVVGNSTLLLKRG